MRVHVPSATDAGAALAISEEYRPALWWVFECTAPEDHWVILDAIYEHRLPLRVVDEIADELCTRIVGWPRGEAMWVWAQSRGAWQMIEGDHLGRGVDVLALDPCQATNVCFSWWQQRFRHDSDGWKKWVRDMQHPIRRYAAASVESAVMTMDQIAALSQAGKAPSPL